MAEYLVTNAYVVLLVFFLFRSGLRIFLFCYVCNNPCTGSVTQKINFKIIKHYYYYLLLEESKLFLVSNF